MVALPIEPVIFGVLHGLQSAACQRAGDRSSGETPRAACGAVDLGAFGLAIELQYLSVHSSHEATHAVSIDAYEEQDRQAAYLSVQRTLLTQCRQRPGCGG